MGDVPVIMLTARDDEIVRVVRLVLVADDYVTKPFAVRELVARVRAIMRRAAVPAGQRPDELSHDRLRINLPSRRVSGDGEEWKSTRLNFRHAQYLVCRLLLVKIKPIVFASC